MLESRIEYTFVNRVKLLGCEVIKLNLIGNSGWPDRLVIMDKGLVAFVELKKSGEEPRPLQNQRISLLKKLGHHVEWFDDAKDAFNYIKNLKEFYNV